MSDSDTNPVDSEPRYCLYVDWPNDIIREKVDTLTFKDFREMLRSDVDSFIGVLAQTIWEDRARKRNLWEST